MIKIKNLTTKGEIYLYGIIVDDSDAQWLRDEDGNILGYQFPADVKAQLDSLKGLPIDVHISSDGGSVSAGIAIANMLAAHDAPTVAYIDSWAASIASVIAFNCNKIIMPENTFIMIHNPAGGGMGESSFLRSIADWLDKIRDTIADTYAKHCGGDIERIKSAMDAETWYTAREASELFDNVEMVEANDVKAVAQIMERGGIEKLEYSKYNSAPTAIKSKVNNSANDNSANANNDAEDVSNDVSNDVKNILDKLQRSFNYEEKG
jgi:ATP-dependent protease ClpP protease subunit